MPRFRPRRTIRPDAVAYRRLALCVLLALLAACGTGRPPAPPQEAPRPPQAQPFAVQEQPFLLDPLTGFPGQVDPGRKERLQAAHRALLAESDVQGAVAIADELLQADPGFAPAHVLVAQIDLGEGKYDKVIARLLPVSDETPQYVASQLVLGRAAELAGDVPLAYSAYREIAPRNPRAFQKVGELHPRALDIVSNRLQEALRQSRLDEAEKHLALLRAWAPSEGRTLEGARA
ncbi:MAG TPA: tetratricopeptide repeat protein, partial [Thermoanaerobaculia bacterium]|nr:tetratricopeptide repeat protein [Thermoanaerobaculia bacterium]